MAQPVKLPPNTIALAGPYTIINNYNANEALLPGQLVEYIAVSTENKIRKHATAGGPAAAMFVKEQDMHNRSVTESSYANNDLVEIIAAQPGAKIWALIPDEANVAAGAYLTSNGDGTLKVAATTDIRIAVADEAVNNTGGTGAVRIRVTVI